MFGLLTTIPIMLTILAFLAYASLIIHGGHLKKVNRTVRRFQLFVAGAIIAGTFPYTVGILNGVYFDLFPQDPYMPLVLDRFTSIGAFLGICLMALIIIVTFIRYSFFFNISKDFAKKFGISLLVLIFLTGVPMIVEGCLFAAKSINDARYLPIVRSLFIGGSLCSYSFMYVYTLSLLPALYSFSQTKRLEKDELFRKLYLLTYSSLAVAVFLFLCLVLAMIKEYRSHLYLIFYHLCGPGIGFSALALVEVFFTINSIIIDIIKDQKRSADQKTNEPASKLIPLAPKVIASTITIRETDTQIVRN